MLILKKYLKTIKFIFSTRKRFYGIIFSLFLHVFFLIFLSKLIIFREKKESKEIKVHMLQIDKKQLEELSFLSQGDINAKIDLPEFTPEYPEAKIKDMNIVTKSLFDVVPNFFSINPSNSALQMSSLYSMRTKSARQSALKRYGGTYGSENAVLKGLRWLKVNQNCDGSWGENSKLDDPLTAFALLAFLGHGVTPASLEFGETVFKAIENLYHSIGTSGNRQEGGYNHAIVLYALAEAYAFTKIPVLKPVLDKGTLRLIKAMNSKGSFSYSYANDKLRCDLSVAGWNYQALKAAKEAGSSTKGLDDAIEKAINLGLKQTHAVKDGFSYSQKGEKTRAMTAVGVFCLQLFGETKSREAQNGFISLVKSDFFSCSWDGKDGQNLNWELYTLYYQTMAIFQGSCGKGKIWKKWSKKLTNELLPRQKDNGSWISPVVSKYGFGSPTHSEAIFKGKCQSIYATSLCCLILEVYYRYPPIAESEGN